MLGDQVIRPALQHKLIADADAAFPANTTRTVALDSSHMALLSMPHEVAESLARVVR